MANTAASLYCPNSRCQAPNSQRDKFCQKCCTPLLRRYLWVIGAGTEAYQVGELIGDRYLLDRPRILLDTQPSLTPETPEEIPAQIAPYLRLSPYTLHVPQVYGRLTLPGKRQPKAVWLLEEAAIFASGANHALEGQLMPELSTAWKEATPRRQLNWLWQLAQLWQPLLREGVASSLLNPNLLRVNNSLIRLQELQLDSKQTPTLQQLGQFWSRWFPATTPAVAEFLQQLYTDLQQGQLIASDQLVALLDQGLNDYGRSANTACTYQIFTATDTGPSRRRNEDACYPPSGNLVSPPLGAEAVAIVCDGIGGHEGGDVASHLAIDTIRRGVDKLLVNSNWEPANLALHLEQVTCDANDAISRQNDSEHRQDRQRMGTTLVMALTRAHEMYITHVGDSRVYWITRTGCSQVTLDDDLASREVRLGYALYRNAVQQSASGSLVQALGMGSSTTLHPSVQRFVLDEDCIFLLCSDGLSDNDRVEQYWQTEVLPAIEGQVSLATATTRLVEIANQQNGHDNVTIALVHCQVTSGQEKEGAVVSFSQPTALPNPTLNLEAPTDKGVAVSRMKTQQLQVPEPTRTPWGLLLGIVLLLGVGGVLAYLLIPGINRFVDPVIGLAPRSTSLPTSTPSPTDLSTSPAAAPSLEAPAVIQVATPTTNVSEPLTGVLLRRRWEAPQNRLVVGQAPAGSVLQVIAKRADLQGEDWLRLRFCSTSDNPSNLQPPTPGAELSPSSPASPAQSSRAITYNQLKPGDDGWIRASDAIAQIKPNFLPTPAQLDSCAVLPPIPADSSTPVPSKAVPSPSPTG
ncbi:MAG: protein phosphatase 2C domain-containing protein [Kastovskya adunca ATA6-11-RM4]|nr:protein phosphatase 2C domain-containing protein [Kastovskya adunca ATA6-11-RM4]